MQSGGRKGLPVRNWNGRALPFSEPTTPQSKSSRKDTKRWCLGKPGREHQPELIPGTILHGMDKIRIEGRPFDPRPFSYWYRVCKVCHKQLRIIESKDVPQAVRDEWNARAEAHIAAATPNTIHSPQEPAGTSASGGR